MKQLIQALSHMPVVRLKSDRDPARIGARRAVMAGLCSVIEKSRRDGGRPGQGRRLFTRDEAIALGALFVLAMREVGMDDVIAAAEQLSNGVVTQLERATGELW